MTTYFRQVELVKSGRIYMMTWIPLQFAKKGKLLELKEEDGWNNGWVVNKVYPAKLTDKELELTSRSYRHTREASDV